jgi:hypothetical protein
VYLLCTDYIQFRTRIVVVILLYEFSYMLDPFSQDIPALAAEASKEHSNVPYIVTAPLGLHELMVVCAH